MKKIGLIVSVFLVILLLVVIIVLSIYNITRYTRIHRLCNMIQNNETTQAIEMIDKIDNLNHYSAPLFTRWMHSVVSKSIELPLVEACKYGNYEVIEALLKRGANPNLYLKGNNSPLEAALMNRKSNRFEIVEMLIEYDVNVNLYGSTPPLFVELKTLIYSQDLAADELVTIRKVILILLNNGSNVVDENGNSVMHYLCFAGEIELLDKLNNDYGYLLNTTNHTGETPLMWAIEGQNLECCRYLINMGVDINIKSESGKTAYDYAIETGNKQITELLRSRDG